MSLRARDRGEKILLNARKRNCETVEIESHDQTEKATIGPVEALTDVRKAELVSTRSMAKALEAWRKNSPDLEGSTLGSQTDRFRLETVSVFMACGLPLSKIDGLRDYLLKHSKLQIFDVSHLRTYLR